MATPAKRCEVEDDSENYNSSAGGGNNKNEKMEIQVEFEGRNPEPMDFHGIKTLLEQLFLKTHIDLSALTDVILSSRNVGSVLKQSEDVEEIEDDDDSDVNTVFGITTVVNLNENEHCLTELKELLLNLSAAHASDSTNTFIKDVLKNTSTVLGLLINERFINIPAQVSIPLFEHLLSEMNVAIKKEMPYKFSHYVMICKLYKTNDNQEQSVYWSNPEEEIFAEESQYSFEFTVETECDKGLTGAWSESDDTLIPYRKVLIFESSKLPIIIEKVKSQS